MTRNLALCALLATLGLVACVRQNAIAVEPNKCSWGACTDAGRSDAATHPPDGTPTRASDAGAADGGKRPVDAGNGDAAVTDDAAVSEDAGATLPPLPDYALVVDDPHEATTLSGNVTIRGHCARFLNVEVWDATHQKPPLARATPNADGTFMLTVDTSTLPLGPVMWTVWGWDSPATQPYTHSATVTLHLTLKAASSTL